MYSFLNIYIDRFRRLGGRKFFPFGDQQTIGSANDRAAIIAVAYCIVVVVKTALFNNPPAGRVRNGVAGSQKRGPYLFKPEMEYLGERFGRIPLPPPTPPQRIPRFPKWPGTGSRRQTAPGIRGAAFARLHTDRTDQGAILQADSPLIKCRVLVLQLNKMQKLCRHCPVSMRIPAQIAGYSRVASPVFVHVMAVIQRHSAQNQALCPQQACSQVLHSHPPWLQAWRLNSLRSNPMPSCQSFCSCWR